ncbi:hypothetical protein Tco_0797044 [Tanacetum coccineum]
MKMWFVGAHMPLLLAMLAGAVEDQGERPAEPADQPPIPDPIPSIVNVLNLPIIEPTTTSPPKEGTNIPPSDHDQPSSSRLNEPDGEPLTSTFVEDKTAGGSFYESSPRSHEETPSAGQPSGVAEDPLTLTALSSLVSKFMQKTTSLESELKDTKKTLETAIITLVRRVKKLEGVLKKRKRKPVISDSDDDAERVEKEIDMDSLLALANASLAEQQSSFVTPSKDKALGESQEKDISSSTLEATHILSQTKLHAERVSKSPAQVSLRSVKTYIRVSKGNTLEDTSCRLDFSPNAVTPGGLTHSSADEDIPADIFITPGSMPIPTGSGAIPVGVSVLTGSSTFPAGSEQVPPASTSLDKGKAKLVDEPTPTQERTFKQLEDERLRWEVTERLHAQEQTEMERQKEELLRQDELLARKLQQDFEMPEQQQKRQQEVQSATMHYTDDDWMTIMAKIQANKELSRTPIGSNLPKGDFASAMVEMVDRKRRHIAEQKTKARRDRPMSQAEQRDFMRTFVKNQSLAIYIKGWTMTYMKSLSADRLKEEFESSHLSTLTQQDFTRASKRLGDELEQPSSKRPKPAEVEATSAAMENTGAQVPIPSEDVRTFKESEVVKEKVESSKRTPRKRKSVARKGLHISKSTIPIEKGDPDVEHKMCIKYASDEEDDSDCYTYVPSYAIVELLPTGLGTFNVIYRKDNSLKYFTSLREILRLVTREDLMTIYGRVVTYYQDKEVDGVGLIL